MLTPHQNQSLGQLVRHLGRDQPSRLLETEAATLPDELVRKHFLAPLAYRAGVDRFRSDFIASALMAEVRERTLHETVEALARASIPVILLKGISYASRLYADPAERPMSDVDLLVPPDAHQEAARVLRRLGYWAAGSHRQRSPLHHAVAFKRKGASIDLHRNIIQPLRSRIEVDGLWRRAVPAEERTDRAWRLDPIDEAVIHLSHVARHEFMVPAINYIDAARLLRRAPGGRHAVLDRARRFRLGRAVSVAMAMTDAMTRGRLAPASVMPSIQEIFAYRPVWRPLQCLRKALLVEGPTELVGLVLVGAYGQLAHRLRT